MVVLGGETWFFAVFCIFLHFCAFFNKTSMFLIKTCMFLGGFFKEAGTGQYYVFGTTN